jgi:hypothetical protein
MEEGRRANQIQLDAIARAEAAHLASERVVEPGVRGEKDEAILNTESSPPAADGETEKKDEMPPPDHNTSKDSPLATGVAKPEPECQALDKPEETDAPGDDISSTITPPEPVRVTH